MNTETLRGRIIEAIMKGDLEALKAMEPEIQMKTEMDSFLKQYTDKNGKGSIPIEAWLTIN